MAEPTTAKYGGEEVTWSQLVSKVGVDRARVEAPELDPKYQQMVKKEGQAKGSQAYTEKYVDPQTYSANVKDPWGWAGYQAGLQRESGWRGAPGLVHGLGSAIGDIVGGVGSFVTGKPNPMAAATDPTKGGGKGGGGKPTGPSAGQQLQAAEDSAIQQMYQGLLGQYTSAENVVNPYISGANNAQAASNAQALAQRFAGGGVQGPDPSVQGILSKDAQAYAAANQAGQQGVATAIGGMSGASQAAANAAPYQQLLNALTSKAQYNIVYGGAQPNVTQSPAYVQEALNAANQLQPSAAGGTTVGTPTAPAPATTASGSAVPPATSFGSSTGQ